jgi:hypothetical protein
VARIARQASSRHTSPRWLGRARARAVHRCGHQTGYRATGLHRRRIFGVANAVTPCREQDGNRVLARRDKRERGSGDIERGAAEPRYDRRLADPHHDAIGAAWSGNFIAGTTASAAIRSCLSCRARARDFNSTLSQKMIDRALERDSAAAAAEYMAQFPSDLEAFVAREVVDPAVVSGRYELAPLHGVVGFCDPRGGSSDSMTLLCSRAPATVLA